MDDAHAEEGEVRTDVQRVIVGALGGFAALLVRYLSHDHTAVMNYLSTPSVSVIGGPGLFYFIKEDLILLPILMILGAIIGWVSLERHRVKLFALGVSAPALITTLHPPSFPLRAAQLVAPAPALAEVRTNTSTLTDPDRTFAIYVGSFSTAESVVRITETLNAPTTSLHAFTTETIDRNGRLFKRIFVVPKFGFRDAR